MVKPLVQYGCPSYHNTFTSVVPGWTAAERSGWPNSYDVVGFHASDGVDDVILRRRARELHAERVKRSAGESSRHSRHVLDTLGT